jgi:hypothetical protein
MRGQHRRPTGRHRKTVGALPACSREVDLDRRSRPLNRRAIGITWRGRTSAERSVAGVAHNLRPSTAKAAREPEKPYAIDTDGTTG